MREEFEDAGRPGASTPDGGREAERTIVIEDEALRRGFTQLPNYLFQVRGLSHSAKLTYALILSYAWQKDYCFPGQETLARDLEVSTRSVIEYLKELQGHQLIRIQRRGLGLTNVYHVLRYPPAPEASPTPSHPEVKPPSHQGVKRRTPPRVSPASLPELRPDADQEVYAASHNKDASLTKAKQDKIQQQHQPAAASPSQHNGVSQRTTTPPRAAAAPDSIMQTRLAKAALGAYGIDNERLLSELVSDPDEVRLQIERLRQELERGAVANPAGWLVEAIRGRYRLTTEEPIHDAGPAQQSGESAAGARHDSAPATPVTPQGMAWEMVCAELRAEITPENYRRWFATTTAVALRDDRLTVSVPDAFHLQWLDRRLRGTIERAAKRVLGETPIEFIVSDRATAS